MKTPSAFLDDGMERWTIRYISKNLWRMHGRYEFDDLMSEAWLVFDKVSRKYIDVSERHLMSLYSRSLANRLHDLARESTKADFVDTDWSGNDDPLAFDEFAEAGSVNSIAAKAIDAGEVVAQVYCAATTGKLDAALIPSGESYDRRFDRTLGLPQGTQSAQKFREFLRSEAL